MKKSIMILVLLVFAASGVFAQAFRVSVGGGGLFDWSFKNGLEEKIGLNKYYYTGNTNMSFGGFLFLDATYAELNASFRYGLITNVVDNAGNVKTTKAGNMMQAGVSVLGKYPLDFGAITFFPLIGAGYNAVLIYNYDEGKKYNDSVVDTMLDLGQICFMGGAGFDFGLTRSLFLRFEALYQLRFASKIANDTATSVRYATLGMGPLVQVGAGYKF